MPSSSRSSSRNEPPARAVRSRRSAKLAVLAAAAVVAREVLHRRIGLLLAGDAQTHAGERGAPSLGDRLAALPTMRGARPLRQTAFGPLDGVLDRVVYLLLYRAFARPTRGHNRTLK